MSRTDGRFAAQATRRKRPCAAFRHSTLTERRGQKECNPTPRHAHGPTAFAPPRPPAPRPRRSEPLPFSRIFRDFSHISTAALTAF